MVCNETGQHDEKLEYCSYPCLPQLEKSLCIHEDPVWPKKKERKRENQRERERGREGERERERKLLIKN